MKLFQLNSRVLLLLIKWLLKLVVPGCTHLTSDVYFSCLTFLHFTVVVLEITVLFRLC